MPKRITNWDRIIWSLTEFLEKRQRSIISLASGFLAGRVINEASIDQSLREVLNAIFLPSGGRPLNVISIVALLLFFTPILKNYLLRRKIRRRYDVVFADLVQRHKSSIISPYPGIAWDTSLSLQTSPHLNRGWSVDSVRIQHSTHKFSVPEYLRQAYQEFLRVDKHNLYSTDSQKFMITANPASFSDNLALLLQTQEVLNSQVQFYKNVVAKSQEDRRAAIHNAVVNNKIDFAHTLSMHIVVVTKDEKVLLTKRSQKVSYYPGAWSCSIEEQVAEEDIRETSERSFIHWARRALYEELGVTDDLYISDNIRVASVFLEADILNIAVCTIIRLDIEWSELDKILWGKPRVDYEFIEWKAVGFSQLIQEIFQPKYDYHPTSAYRMLMALIQQYGEPKVAEDFFTGSQIYK